MSLALPAADSPLREHIDVAQLAAIGAHPGMRFSLPGLPEAVRSARRLFAGEPAACAMHMLVMRTSGVLQLWRFDRAVAGGVDSHQPSGAEAVWTFGKL